jgi:hypothetical protein
MSAKSTSNNEPGSLKDLLQATDKDLRDLFIKVMNLHAAHQIVARTQAQLTADVRKHIEESLDK